MNLSDKLLMIGGHSIMGDQILYDPDASSILRLGRVFLEKDSYFEMEKNACHWNVSKLYCSNLVEDIVIGYALSKEGFWFQHTWGLNCCKVIETSRVNFYNVDIYYGIVLESPIEFVKLCLDNPKGNGKVRRHV